MATFKGQDLIDVLTAMSATFREVAITDAGWNLLGWFPVTQALGLARSGGAEGVGNRKRIRRLRYFPPAPCKRQPRIDPTEFRTFAGVKSGGVLSWEFSHEMATAASKRAATRARRPRRAKPQKAYPKPVPRKIAPQLP